MTSIKRTHFSTLLPGDVVFVEGAVRKISEVNHRGKDAPYFRFENHEGSKTGNWYSFKLCENPPVLSNLK